MRIRTIVVAVFFLACAGPAGAQNLTLAFHDGRVSIDASNVPVRTLLSEWGRLGGTKVVGAERISGTPLTIHLENVPEAQALEIVLRNVAGYMAAPRQAGAAGASAYDRILVLPTSSAPAATASNRPSPAGPNGARNTPGAGGMPKPPEAEPEPVPAPQEVADTGVNEPPFQFPQQNPFGPNPFGAAQAGQPGPFGTPIQPGGQPPVIQFGPAGSSAVTVNQPPQQPTVNPFGIAQPSGTTPGFGVGSPTPGVIIAPPQPPGQPVRPPGNDQR